MFILSWCTIIKLLARWSFQIRDCNSDLIKNPFWTACPANVLALHAVVTRRPMSNVGQWAAWERRWNGRNGTGQWVREVGWLLLLLGASETPSSLSNVTPWRLQRWRTRGLSLEEAETCRCPGCPAVPGQPEPRLDGGRSPSSTSPLCTGTLACPGERQTMDRQSKRERGNPSYILNVNIRQWCALKLILKT